jgi:uncharacterized protein DUF742
VPAGGRSGPSEPGRQREPGQLERPYVLTRGRTRAAHDAELEIETLVSSTLLADTPLPGLSVEHEAILRLSLGLISVAEISARLSVPLGVARVLVGDLVEQQLVAIHRPQPDGLSPQPELLRRVLDGLLKL